MRDFFTPKILGEFSPQGRQSPPFGLKLDSRLAAVVSLVRVGSSVADIGSDHALLPCFLWQCGFTDIIATDINPGPLEFARKTLQKYDATGVQLLQTDGLRGVPPRDDIIIAGLGGETIAKILADCENAHKKPNSNTRFILQPMTKHEELRRGLYRAGFEILAEIFAVSAKKFYTIIHAKFTGKTCEIDEIFAYIGKQNNPIYIKNRLEKIQKAAKGNPKFAVLAAEIERKFP
ncbi:MAG: class I SAM-dependent methyltransferase [Oscillospiraceae bacterium]|nr:class I SAM-dependent methyltransferase [Oscillospiraceae bacterium]